MSELRHPFSEAESHLTRARSLVLEWLRAPHRDPEFLAETKPADPQPLSEAIAHRFLQRIHDTGFQCEVVQMTQLGKPAYEARWTHRGSTFVGFKQPPPETTREDALVAGCAALLENQWCRARLPS